MNETRHNNCVFCKGLENERILYSTTYYHVILDAYPVMPGHVLIIPKRHVTSFLQLTNEERIELFSLIDMVMKVLKKNLNATGFNIGFNIGESAGQTIEHLHCHVIPRYKSTEREKRGGLRKVILAWPEGINWRNKWINNRLDSNAIALLRESFQKFVLD
ncbi:MAG: HIT family protein [Candidatus Asgardarchaeum californiense]|nr:MAG: HIT family protein [Candidatus Asgardarchaeum californiense]